MAVETTRQRMAADGHRNVTAGLSAISPKGRPSQPDPYAVDTVERRVIGPDEQCLFDQ
jgi:hypothetical protein